MVPLGSRVSVLHPGPVGVVGWTTAGPTGSVALSLGLWVWAQGLLCHWESATWLGSVRGAEALSLIHI